MNGFDFYPQAWALYILLGVAMLFLLDMSLRKRSFNFRAGLLCLIAVGAFTPQTVSESDSLAPLVITSLLNAEAEGISAIYESLLTLIVIWGIAFSAVLAIKHFIEAKKHAAVAKNNPQPPQ